VATQEVLWTLPDQLGTVRDLARMDAQTGATSVANHRVYDSFGNRKSQTNAAVDCLFAFTGLPFDTGSGTYRTPTRPDDPLVGRWAQPDKIVFGGGQTNLDVYCGNSPTNATDPTGQSLVYLYRGYGPPPDWWPSWANCFWPGTKENWEVFADPTFLVGGGVVIKGPTVVYRAVTIAGKVEYVGITNNLARRAAEHLASKGIKIEKLLATASRADARAVEQVLIEIHGLGKNGGTLMNRINAIAKTNPTYAALLRRGYELLKSIGYVE
jgi:RHS repeat-associated protein